jgi:Flp pilus assembly protein TadG
MEKRTTGQSMVEMALLLPFFLLVVFGIIDMGWYIYGYSTVYQAARNGAQKASELPPQIIRVSPSLNRTDTCVSNVLSAAQSGAVLFPDLTTSTNVNNTIAINYPATDASGNPIRALGYPVEINITYNLNPLTPLWRFITFGTQGTMRVTTTARRSIESLGENPTAANYVACN